MMTSISFVLPLLLATVATVFSEDPLVVEIHLTMDAKFVKKYVDAGYSLEFGNNNLFAELKSEADYFIHEANKLLKTLPTVKVEARLKDLVIEDRFDDAPLPDVVDGKRALEKASFCTEDNGANFDLKMVWTGSKIEVSGSHYTSYNYRDSMCHERMNVLLMDFRGVPREVLLIARKIVAMSGGKIGTCSQTTGYILSNSYWNTKLPDAGKFSSCADTSMKHFIQTSLKPMNGKANCLLDTTTPAKQYVAPAEPLAILYPEAMCRREAGPGETATFSLNYGFYGNKSPEGNDLMCNQIVCKHTVAVPHSVKYAGYTQIPDGMVCGEHMVCMDKKCVPNNHV